MQAVTLLGALILVEMLPVEAWLIVFAEGVNGGIARVAAPLWYLVLVTALAWAVAWRFERSGIGRVLLVSAPLFVLALVTLLRLSPSSYGTEPLDLTGGGSHALDPLLVDLKHGVRQFSSDVALTLLVMYVWWRGLMLGSTPPQQDDVSRRFQWSMAAFLLALFGLAAAGKSERGSLFGAMSLLLPVEVFACLAAAGLANVSYARLRSRESQTGETERRWVGSALLLAGLVATLALVINIFVNFESVSALLRQLGPVGVALDGAAHWLINAFIQVLSLFAAPLQFFFDWLQHQGHRLPTQTSQPQTCLPGSTNATCVARDALRRPNVVSPVVLIALNILIVVVVIVIFVVLLQRLLARQALEDSMMVQEEREVIGGRGLFGEQVRALFARSAKKEPAAERLAPGTVRAMYRDMLRTAAQHGLGRAASETPDEYARRLAEAPPLAATETEHGDVKTLSTAYEEARYGEHEPAPEERAVLQTHANRVIGRLRSQPPPA